MKNSQNHSAEAHGSVTAYIIGFVLSLIFTIIPYQLVVNKSITGSVLLVIILSIAVLQMLIQIFFFLHLGRGPKPLYNVIFFGATVATILLVVVGSIWIMNHLNYNMAPSDAAQYLAQKEGISQVEGEQTGACQGTKTQHKITIFKNEVDTPFINAKRCDTITFINLDETPRKITFGTHPKHESYAGDSELSVRMGRGKSITLNEVGTFQYHDHLDPRINGIFVVKE